MSLDTDRVRHHTAASVLRSVDDRTIGNLIPYADATPAEVDGRMIELEREWDTDRVLEVEAATVGLVGLALGTLLRPTFLAIPAIVGGAVFMHAVKGPYPLLSIFRRLGIRSSPEIARERYALKALRGDFSELPEQSRRAPELRDMRNLRPTVEDDRYH